MNNMFHLSDHDYFTTQVSPKKPVRVRKNIKITELRAVFNCKMCGYRALKRENLSTHTCIQGTVKYVPCTSCDKTSSKYSLSKTLLNKNQATKPVHIPPGNFKCPQCSFFTANKASLKGHKRIHFYGTPYKCTECEFAGRDLKELIKHYNDEQDLACDCGYTTHINKQMVSHMRTHNDKYKEKASYLCAVCSYSTVHRSTYDWHLQGHLIYKAS